MLIASFSSDSPCLFLKLVGKLNSREVDKSYGGEKERLKGKKTPKIKKGEKEENQLQESSDHCSFLETFI